MSVASMQAHLNDGTTMLCQSNSIPFASDYRDSAEQNAVGNAPFSIPATTDNTVFRSSLHETTDARDHDGVRKHPIPVGNPDTRPEQSDCYMSVLSVVVITTSPIQRIRSICSEVTALLSHYSCFCSFSVYPKDDYSFVLDNTYCDFCIASKSILSEVSYFYPDVLFSYVDDSSTDLRTNDDVLFIRIFNIVRAFSANYASHRKLKEPCTLCDLSSLLLPSLSAY